jgi:Tol biopolymer transport system component
MKTEKFGKILIETAACLIIAALVPMVRATPAQLISARNPAVPLPAGGNDNSFVPRLSSDGRYVVFVSAANDLTPNTNGQYCLNVYLRDRSLNATYLISSSTNGRGGNADSVLGQVSANGRYVVFQSDASDLVAGDTNSATDIFLRDTYTGTTRLISVAANGGFANGASTDPVMTPDGTCVAFISAATNLVAGDTNGIPDVFVRDLITQTTWLMSVNARPPVSNTNPVVATPVITPDGRFVAFFSSATNLVSAAPATSPAEVYVRDRMTGKTIWTSTNAASILSATLGMSGKPAYHPRLSDDGRYVTFKAGATAPTGAAVILRYDTVTATTAVVNTNGLGGAVDLDDGYGPEMTPDGRYLALVQHEGALSSSNSSVHVWDAQGAVDTLVSDNGSGVPTNTFSRAPVISTNGQFVAFLSNATNLTGDAVSNGFHIFLRNLQAATTQLADVDTNGVGSTDNELTSLSLSADGRYVAFNSPDGRLVNLDKNHADDVFVRDTVGAATEMISQRNASVIPQAADALSTLSPVSVSADGRWAVFASAADDLVLDDTNRQPDAFARDLVNGTNMLASVGNDGGPALGGGSGNAAISADGRYVVFISGATNLVTGPVNTNGNVFRRDLQSGTTVLVSVGTDGVSPGNNDASDFVMSRDGRYIAFISRANNLISGIPTTATTTCWRDMNSLQIAGFIGGQFAPSLSSNGLYLAYATNSTLRVRDMQLSADVYTNSGVISSAAIDPTGSRIVYRMTNGLYVDNISPRSNLFAMPTKSPIRNAGCWSDDGRWLTFVSTTNLGAGDDGTNKVYLRDFQTGTLSLIGVAGPGTDSLAALSDGPVLSGNGQFVTYRSIVTNTVIGDHTAPPNVFLRDRLTGSNTVLTAGQAGSSPMPWVSRPVISDSGTTIAFVNTGSGLATGDLNRAPDAFGVLFDSDCDGIPDWWLMEYFGHATGQAGDHSLAIDDADGDGMSNLQEYFAGTSPIDPASVFRLSATVPGDGTVSLTWPSVTGKSYQVQYRTNLDDSTWLPAPGDVWVEGSQGYYLAPEIQPHSFYRVYESN